MSEELPGSQELKFVMTVFLNRTVIKKEEKMEKKEEKKPEDIKKEEKDEDELKPGPTNRSRVTKSGEQSLPRAPREGRAWWGGRGRCRERVCVVCAGLTAGRLQVLLIGSCSGSRALGRRGLKESLVTSHTWRCSAP